eukprot:3405267-Ditylum_brightwellii.AAC.2
MRMGQPSMQEGKADNNSNSCAQNANNTGNHRQSKRLLQFLALPHSTKVQKKEKQKKGGNQKRGGKGQHCRGKNSTHMSNLVFYIIHRKRNCSVPMSCGYVRA